MSQVVLGAASLRCSSRSLFSSALNLKPPHQFFFHNPPYLDCPAGFRTHAVRPPGTLTADDDSGDENQRTSRSRNELKREARRAVRWGMELASFSVPQIKRVLRVASLEQEVFDAIMLVKRLGPDVREGKRRQFNYIGRLLRSAQPELLDSLIQASKDGDNSKLIALSGQTFSVEDDEEEEEDSISEEEGYENHMEVAVRWFDGLIDKDPSITNEVYSIHNVDFDRQELRRLVRQVQSIQESLLAEESGPESDSVLTRAKKPLIRFLQSLAKKSLVE